MIIMNSKSVCKKDKNKIEAKCGKYSLRENERILVLFRLRQYVLRRYLTWSFVILSRIYIQKIILRRLKQRQVLCFFFTCFCSIVFKSTFEIWELFICYPSNQDIVLINVCWVECTSVIINQTHILFIFALNII